MDIGGTKLLVSRKNVVVNKDSIGIDKDLTKDQNLNTIKMYYKRRKSSARFPDRKARNRLCACHCIAGNATHCCLVMSALKKGMKNGFAKASASIWKETSSIVIPQPRKHAFVTVSDHTPLLRQRYMKFNHLTRFFFANSSSEGK